MHRIAEFLSSNSADPQIARSRQIESIPRILAVILLAARTRACMITRARFHAQLSRHDVRDVAYNCRCNATVSFLLLTGVYKITRGTTKAVRALLDGVSFRLIAEIAFTLLHARPRKICARRRRRRRRKISAFAYVRYCICPRVRSRHTVETFDARPKPTKRLLLYCVIPSSTKASRIAQLSVDYFCIYIQIVFYRLHVYNVNRCRDTEYGEAGRAKK